MVSKRSFCLALAATVASVSAWALQDPTRPTDPAHYFGTETMRDKPTWALQSVLSSPDRRVAVINGVRVREGDRIGMARVVSIRPAAVVLKTDYRTVTLRLWPAGRRKVNP
ncbi:MAG: general secretion pathway protein GspB [Gammaproteobacteria bacterium]|jgi:MSHA biogenesis protein MshK